MSTFRKRASQHFTKSAVEERIKRPKEPVHPTVPIEPSMPAQFLNKNRYSLDINIESERSVVIPFDKIFKLRSQINMPDEDIYLMINTVDSYCGDGEYYPEVESVYFEWYDKVEDPKYPSKLEKYHQDLAKYHDSVKQYDIKMQEYKKSLKEYKKQLKAYHLEQMRKKKEQLEKQIAKAEKSEGNNL